MSAYNFLATIILVTSSIAQYVMYENWQAAMYFLVASGFYALWCQIRNNPPMTINNYYITASETNTNEPKGE